MYVPVRSGGRFSVFQSKGVAMSLARMVLELLNELIRVDLDASEQ